MIIKKVKEVKDFDVKEAYGQDAEGVSIRWISEKRTGGDEYLHNFAFRYFTFKPNAYMNSHKHPWEQEIAVTKGKIQVLGAANDQILREGDVGYFPANEVHGFKNLSDGDSEFYCVIGCVGKGENCSRDTKLNKLSKRDRLKAAKTAARVNPNQFFLSVSC